MISYTDILRKKEKEVKPVYNERNPVEIKRRDTSAANDGNGNSNTTHKILHLVYKKVPVTVETKRRQYAEQLLQKYSIKKEKTGDFWKII